MSAPEPYSGNRMEYLSIRRAIISVTNKKGLEELAAFLVDHGVELVSTGGTMRALTQAGLPATPVSEVTGFPEILGGRVKTLHPKIHGGILADKDNAEHMEAIAALDIRAFELVCVNLYDFAGAMEQQLSLKETVEEIDIGGPCLLRAAAKNFHSVLVLPDPQWYNPAMEEMASRERETGQIQASLEFRQAMACRAFDATSRYDALISSYLRP